jgi:hypothetical protein
LRNFPLFTRGNVVCQGEEIVGGKSRKLLLAGNNKYNQCDKIQYNDNKA